MSLEAARRLLHAQRPDLAEREARRWLARHPDDADGHAILGWSLALRKLPGAVEAAREAVRLAPESPYTHAVLGEVHARLGQFRRAEAPLRRAVELAPESPAHYAMLAAVILDQRFSFRARKALRITEAGLALNPGHAACARVRAMALMRLLRFRRAREAAAYAQRLDPENPHGHAVAGWTHLVGRGNRQRSRDLLRAALRADPTNELAQHGLRKADEMARMAAAVSLEVERRPWALHGAAALLILFVAMQVVWPPADDAAPLVIALATLVPLEAFDLWARFTRRGRAVRDELRAPGVLSRGEVIQARIVLALFVALAVISVVAYSVVSAPQRAGAPPTWHLPWNHQKPPGVPRSNAGLRQSLGT